MATKRFNKRPIAEMNVVPYIDVMLVLLVIFMITAPLLTQGVKVDLPQATAEPLKSQETEPMIVSIDAEGQAFINIGDEPEQPVDAQAMVTRVAAVLKYKPATPVMVKGDRNANYGDIVRTMALLQRAGVPSVGLVTETYASGEKR